METAYFLAPDYSFVDPAAIKDPAFKAGLLNKNSGEILLLNAELGALLNVFRIPVSLTDVAQFFAHQLAAPLPNVRAAIQPSVETFIQRGILVTADSLRQKAEHPFPTLSPGTRIKDYTVLKVLSSSPPIGIYLVENLAHEPYVLKKLFTHPHASRSRIRSQKKLFLYEFRVLSHLKDCTWVNRLVELDANESIGVLDYFAGISLRRFILRRHSTLTPAHRLALFYQLLEAVAGVHSRKVLHGDLHYSNLLVNRKKQLKLIDFDLAYLWRDRSTKKIPFGGITDFIPPERLTDDIFHQSAGAPDFRAEVYQVGVLGYFIYHARLPFVGHTWRNQVHAIRHLPPVWESPCPPSVRLLIETALHKDPQQRYASAVLMADAARQTA
ncbi:protein kinase [Spirosoma taeanense]|uniref:Protein kinase n=1 Tax=Spirosoma taeanense TaxID=2735870 RepID=A0A6M5Y993_9BACT|nr:protein kinase [Spirosoma taeanense]QJW89352.1 protein kinase [Spirosoma taeanense]